MTGASVPLAGRPGVLQAGRRVHRLPGMPAIVEAGSSRASTQIERAVSRDSLTSSALACKLAGRALAGVGLEVPEGLDFPHEPVRCNRG